MDLEDARRFLRGHPRAVLTTRRRDGRPQMSPVLVAVTDAGQAVVSTRETAMKTHNARRDPTVWLCVLSDGFFGDWIQVQGTATVVPLPEAMDGLITYYRTLAGEHPDWEDYRQAMVRERRVLLTIDLTAAGPDRRG
jgi:PPOX class probable F420-dependent enzyme